MAADLPRVIGWVSGGAASAVTCKLGIAKYGLERVSLAYIDTGSEHPDTQRFLADLEIWFGKPIERLKSASYTDTWTVWERSRFLRGPMGAKCTAVLKRKVRGDYERAGDHHLFGFTAEEGRRGRDFKRRFCSTMTVEFPLIDQQVSKADCYALVERAGIKLPEPYLLGFDNNNCIPWPSRSWSPKSGEVRRGPSRYRPPRRATSRRPNTRRFRASRPIASRACRSSNPPCGLRCRLRRSL